jgi:hypothetical protein
VDNLVYPFGGGSNDNGNFNHLSILNLSISSLEFQIVNKAMNVTTFRKGHAIEAYNDKFYMFGGFDGNKKR